MRILIGILIMQLGMSGFAQKSDAQWSWYYAAFYSPTSKNKVLLRSGTAVVKMSESEITLYLVEKDVDGMQATFSGRIKGARNIHGTLKGFFPSGVDNLSGIYRQMGEKKSCRWQEVVLRPSVPDGSALVLSRIEGPCQ